MTAELRSAAFGDRRDARQTLLEIAGEADELEAVVVVKFKRDRSVSVSWSDALDKLQVMGLLALGEALAREWEG